MLTFTINLDDDLVCHTISPTSVADTCLHQVNPDNQGNESQEYPMDTILHEDDNETACSDNDNDILIDMSHLNTSNESIVITQALTMCEHLIQSIAQCKEKVIHIKQDNMKQMGALQQEVEERLMNVEKYCIEINDNI